jgi:predicted TIM-barrel fold metal-dependent hydrolase
MMLDFHTHIFSPYARDHRDQLAKEEPFFSFVYADKRERMIGAEELLNGMEENGVEASVVCGSPWQEMDAVRRENDYLLESAQKYPAKIIPFITLPKEVKAAIAELERCTAAGARGVGELAPGTYGDRLWDREIMKAIFEAVRERELPLLIHVNEPVGHPYPGKGQAGLCEIESLVIALQGIKAVLAHWGGGFFFYELMPEIAAICQGVYYDTAASPFLYNKQIYKIALAIIGPQRILFGSDFPLIPPARYKQEMEEAGLKENELAAILRLNAKRLLDR